MRYLVILAMCALAGMAGVLGAGVVAQASKVYGGVSPNVSNGIGLAVWLLITLGLSGIQVLLLYRAYQPCPACQSLIRRHASRCPYCQHSLPSIDRVQLV